MALHSPAVLLVATDSGVAADLTQMLRGSAFEPLLCSSPEAGRAQARTRRADLALIDLPGQPEIALGLVESFRDGGVASVLVGGAEVQSQASDRHTGPAAILVRPFTSSHLTCVLHVVNLVARVDELIATAAHSTLSPEIEQRIRQVAATQPAATILCGAGGGAHCIYPGLNLLSPREAEIARWLLQGQRVPAISRRLSISPHTVRNHVKAMFRKFGVHSQSELVDRLMGQSTVRQA